MKISLKWINDYVDVEKYFSKPEEIAALLTGAGLEVEGFENTAKKFDKVVVGHIIELGKHPNADKLTLCQVDVGDKKHLQIVCGAKNHKQGDKVVVATVGAVLPGDFAIKLSKIRDVESQGMLCSESELGFKKESEGIVILPADAKVGMPFAEYSELNDIVYDIKVTPNRADCLSHVGLAREISCLLNVKMKDLSVPQFKVGSKKADSLVDVDLKDDDLCPRYCGRGILGVKVGPSPKWLKARVESVGLNSINNVVDVTNYAMMEYGQPLHAFDLQELKGKKLSIEKSKPNEKFKSFDGTEIELTGSELTIRDSERAVALAGIVGGLNSGVTEKTKDIFLEAAHFNARGVRRTSRRFGIETDSGYRFSRGTDPNNVVHVMNRAVQLIIKVAGGEATSDYYDCYPKKQMKKPVEVRKRILEERLGYAVDLGDFTKWMERLHCETKLSGDRVTVTPPAFRVDLEIEMDFVEEYARLNGYAKISETLPDLTTRPTEHATPFLHEEWARRVLTHQGYFEARNYNFVSGKWQSAIVRAEQFKNLGLDVMGSPVTVQNPLSEETSVMRQSLLPGLITNLLHNTRHGNSFGRLFEVGYGFSSAKAAEYAEFHRVALLAWGQHQALWSKTDRPVVYDLKSALEGVMNELRATVQWRKPEEKDVPSFIHPARVATLFYEGKLIGFIGALHPMFCEEHKIRQDAAVAELNLSLLMRGQPRSSKAKKISKFPSVERDFALLMPLDLPAQDLLREIEKLAQPLIQSVEVFDVFRGKGVPEGEQSVAVRMTLQSMDATLTDAELTQLTDKVLSGLTKKFPVRLRQ